MDNNNNFYEEESFGKDGGDFDESAAPVAVKKKKRGWIFAIIIPLILLGAFAAYTVLNPFSSDSSSEKLDGFSFRIENGTAIITGADRERKNVVIPDYINEYPVVAIDNNAFLSYGNIESVVIPASVRYIGENAFKYCGSLRQIEFSSGIEAIGQSAFKGCSALSDIEIPDSVSLIGKSAFEDCDALESITLPFVGEMSNGDVNTHFGYIFGADIYSKQASAVPDSIKNVVITQPVKLGDGAFYHCPEIETVTFENGAVYVGNEAFMYCYNLQYTNALENATYIGNRAFSHCSSVVEIVIGTSLEQMGDSAFESCSALKYVSIENGAKHIGKSAFEGCDRIEAVNVSATVHTIDERAFASCIGLRNINLENGIKEIGNESFVSCFSLTSIVIPDSVTSLGSSVFASCRSLSSATLGNGLNEVSDDLFYYCESLRRISLPDSILEIGDSAFCGCSSLSYVDIPSSVETIGKNAFSECEKLETVNLKSNISIIGASAFKGCTSLYDITLPASLTAIGVSAFEGCSSLEGVSIPDGVIEISERTFCDCTSLSDVSFPNNLTSIYQYAFYNTAVMELDFPTTLTHLGYRAFGYCNSVMTVYIPKSVVRMESLVFGDYTGVVYCEAESSDGWFNDWVSGGVPVVWDCLNSTTDQNGASYIYKDDILYSVSDTAGATVYKVSKNAKNVYISEYIQSGTNTVEVTSISPLVFSGTLVESVSVPSTVEHIGDQAFARATSLRSVILNEGVRVIGAEAFADSLISEIVFPSTLRDVQDNAFLRCLYLKSVTLNSGISSLGDSCFSGCGSLTEIVLPSSLTDIGWQAFSECEALTIYVEADTTDGFSAGWSGACPIVLSCNSSDTDEQGYAYTVVDGIRYALKDKNAIIVKQPYCITSASFPDFITYKGETYEITIMAECAFMGCHNLEEVDFSNVFTSLSTVPASAFLGCSSLERVLLKSELTDSIGITFISSIGMSAFEGCTSLKHITLPDTITAIGASAFKRCVALTEIEIPSETTLIGKEAFTGCTSLLNAKIPRSVTQMGEFAFTNCSSVVIYCESSEQAENWADGWYDYNARVIWGDSYDERYEVVNDVIYRINGGLAWVTKQSFNEDILFIPSYITTKYGKYQVVGIDESAFEGCSSLKEVYIGEGVKAIKDYAFGSCTKLSHISLPSSLESIGSYAFFECQSLYEIYIPKSVTEIGDYAFRNAFYVTIYAESDAAHEGWNLEWNDGERAVFWGFEKEDATDDFVYTTQDGCAHISSYMGNSDTVIFPKSISGYKVTSIELKFNNSPNVKYIFIPDTVTSIGLEALEDCSALEYIEVDENNAHYSSLGGCLYNKDRSVLIKYPQNNGCELFYIPNTVNTIRSLAFDGCGRLSVVSVHSGVTVVEEMAFINCDGITVCPYIDAKPDGWDAGWYMGDVTVKWGSCAHRNIAVIPGVAPTCVDSGISEGRYCTDCQEVLEVQQPLDPLGHTEAVIPKVDPTCEEEGLTEGRYCSVCDYVLVEQQTLDPLGHNLEPAQVTAPTCTERGYTLYTCSRCDYSETYDYTEALGHTEMVIPKVDPTCEEEGLTEGRYCSVCDYVLVEQEVIDSLGHIWEIDKVVDPTCTERGYTLYTCSRSDCFKTDDYTEALGHQFDDGIRCSLCNELKPSEGLEYTLSEDKMSYTVTDISTCEDTVIVISSTYNDLPVLGIGEKAFENCQSITSVIIPESVTSIGNYAFHGCTSLESIVIPESVTSIGRLAFEGCTSLESIVIPESVTSIGDHAFERCTSLKSVVIPEGVTSIGVWAFYGCTSLESIVIPESVTSIGYDAFYGCEKLTIYLEAQSQPSGWDTDWNSDARPVEWGYSAPQADPQ